MPSSRRRSRSRRPGDLAGDPGAGVELDLRTLAELEADGITTARSLSAESHSALVRSARAAGLATDEATPFAKLAAAILAGCAHAADEAWAHGIIEIGKEGWGLIRISGTTGSPDDVYVPAPAVKRYGIRQGDTVGGVFRPNADGERFARIVRVELVAGTDPETARRRPHFGDLTPIHPIELLNLETEPRNLTGRLINLVNPLGKGQRALVVSPPKAGKTTVLKHIAAGITANYPEIALMVVLIGERPEEVTDMRRSVRGEVMSSTFDEPTEHHTHVAEFALEIAKRRAEAGEDVVLLLDSITRLARAYNLALPSSGRTLSGGIDPVAIFPPKQFFGAARKLEEGGSLTIIGTCLVDTGSKMDEVIYEEFKGTGNSELVLDRRLAEKRIFPAIDVQRSGTRREELLLDEGTLRMVWTMRRMLSAVGANEGIELLLNRLGKSESNAEFLASLTKGTDPTSGAK